MSLEVKSKRPASDALSISGSCSEGHCESIRAKEKRAHPDLAPELGRPLFFRSSTTTSAGHLAAMPRENQKRGRRAKHKQSEIVKEPAVVKIKARLPSPVLVGDATGTATAEEASPWPLLDPETRAYFEQIQSRILELEELGLGQAAAPGEDLDEEDGALILSHAVGPIFNVRTDRVLLIRGALSSLQGHEIELATDANASFILERLLHSMDDFARRVLADRFSGQCGSARSVSPLSGLTSHRYAALAKDRFASHVLQSLFSLSAQTIDREVRRPISS